MSDALTVPDELIQLQRAADAAFAGLGEVAAGFPESTLDWSPEQQAAWQQQWETWSQAAQAVQAAVTEHAEETGQSRYEVEAALKRAARHAVAA